LAPEEILAGLGAEWKFRLLQGSFVTPQLCSDRCEQSDVARRQHVCFPIGPPYPDIANQPRAGLGNDARYSL
jgi:hypothetical protein